MNERQNESRNEIDQNEDCNEQYENFPLDISDPGNWKKIDQNFRDLIVEKGPMRDNDVTFPKDSENRHFSSMYYTRRLLNGEKHDRKWLLNSKTLDRVFCFCCKLFKHDEINIQLASEGVKDWKNLSNKLKTHETSSDHIINMRSWVELETRLQKNKVID